MKRQAEQQWFQVFGEIRCTLSRWKRLMRAFSVSVKLHLRDGRTDGRTNTHGNNVHRSPPSRRVDVAATRDKRTDEQTPRIIFAASVRPSLRWSLTLIKFNVRLWVCGYLSTHYRVLTSQTLKLTIIDYTYTTAVFFSTVLSYVALFGTTM